MIGHSPALDGLRGLAILLVLAHHLSIVRSDISFDAGALELLHTGWVGVDLFFVLSGFLITGILVDARDSDRYFVSFYARRTLRIFPLYYLVVFVSYHVFPLFPVWERRLVGLGPIPHESYFWLFLSNFVFADQNQFQHGVLTVAWTLAIEEQFYLIWAAVVWLCPMRWLGPLCLFIVMAVPALRAIAAANGASFIEIHVQTPYRADALAVGAWLAWMLRQPRAWSLAPFGPWATAVGVAGIIALVWWDGHNVWDTLGKHSLGYSFLALASAGLLVSAHTRPQTSWWPRLFSAAWLRSVGRYSYCLYLIHLPVMWAIRYVVFDPRQTTPVLGSMMPAQALFWIIVFVPAFCLAWLSWRCFEQPILRLKRFFPY
jgi:peptidoglycan/LPS O-acetylase OafA/YrhL